MYTRAIVVMPVHNLQKVEGHLAPAKCPIAQLVKPLICHDDKWVLINVVFLQYLTQILCYSALTIAVYLTFFSYFATIFRDSIFQIIYWGYFFALFLHTEGVLNSQFRIVPFVATYFCCEEN